MRKIISILITSTVLFFFGVTGSMADWSAGLSVTHGEYTADGEENEGGEIAKKTGAIGVTYPIVFLEKELDNGISVGLDIIPKSMASEEATRTDYNVGAGNAETAAQQTTGNDGGTTGDHLTHRILDVDAGGYLRPYAEESRSSEYHGSDQQSESAHRELPLRDRQLSFRWTRRPGCHHGRGRSGRHCRG